MPQPKSAAFAYLGTSPAPGRESKAKKDIRHGLRPSDSRRQLVGDEQIGTASKADKAEVCLLGGP